MSNLSNLQKQSEIDINIGCPTSLSNFKEGPFFSNVQYSWTQNYLIWHHAVTRPPKGTDTRSINCRICGKEIELQVDSAQSQMRCRIIGLLLGLTLSTIFLALFGLTGPSLFWACLGILLGFGWYFGGGKQFIRLNSEKHKLFEKDKEGKYKSV
ncbi:MAG: hypothetical protein FD156_931 [Nitrospirae bacterium]|nr:MAG: hypothetical protein FD156_931 [Nitrospirota bacterium]